MATFTYPTPNQSLKSMAIAICGSGFIVPTLYSDLAWFFSGQAVSQFTTSGLSATTATGYVGAASDASGNGYMLQLTGQITKVASGSHALTRFTPTLPNKTAEGVAYLPGQGTVYGINSDGTLQALVSGTTMTPVVTTFGGSAPTLRLGATASTLYTIQPNAALLSSMVMGSVLAGVTGQTTTPMTVPNCMSVSGTNVAVGGLSPASLGSGFTFLSGAPNGLSFVGVQQSAGAATSLTPVNGAWSLNSTLTGLGHPFRIGWAPDSLSLLVTDPVSGRVFKLGYNLGSLSLSQTISVSAATNIAVSTSGDRAIVLQTGINALSSLILSGATWSSGATAGLAIGQPTSIVFTNTSAFYIGWASGVSSGMINVSGLVTFGAATNVGFIPGYLTIDSQHNVYAAGTSGSNGSFAVLSSGLSITASGSYVGSVSGAVLVQGQLLFADAVNDIIRVYGSFNWTQQSSGVAPAALDTLASAGQTVFAAGSTQTLQYGFTGPYQLQQASNGVVGVYNGSTWVSANLSASGLPEAVGWSATNTIYVATLQNNLYEFSSGLTLIGVSAIVEPGPQPATTPVGISSMITANGHLYATTSLNDSIVTVK